MTRDRFQVFWAEAAIRDLEEIVDFVAQEAPMAAQRLFNRIKQRSTTLASFPARGRVVPELAKRGVKIYRELILPPHRLMYRIEAHRVLVVAVFDGRRDLEDVLVARLMRP
jgi:plasmid stabilization system protein ParE